MSTRRQPATVDFLCIGAQRSGTTWLAWNLREHPGIWIPPCKEVHYFSRSTKYPSPSHLECRGLAEKFLGRNQQAQTWRWLFLGYARKWLARADWKDKPARLTWIWSYFFQRPTDEWYLRLFQQGQGKVCGEVTPDYSLLEAEDVARVAELLPNVKILFLLRNPLDRTLSQLRYHMDGKAAPNLHRASEDELLDFATAPGQLRRGDHVKTHETWSHFFPPGNIHLAFFEDICERPDVVLGQAEEFLGVERPSSVRRHDQRKSMNGSTPHFLPRSIIARLAEAHEPIVQDCARYFGGHALGWPAQLRGAINKAA